MIGKVQLQRCANYIGQTFRMSRWFSTTQKAGTTNTRKALKSKLGEKHAILGKKTKHYRNNTLFNVKPSIFFGCLPEFKHLLKKN